MTKLKEKRKSYACISLGCEGLGKVFLGGVNLENKNPVKVVVDQLKCDLEYRPEDFSCGHDKIYDNKTDVTYSIDFYYHLGVLEPYRMPFGWMHGIRFLRAVKKWKASNVVNACLGLKPGGSE